MANEGPEATRILEDDEIPSLRVPVTMDRPLTNLCKLAVSALDPTKETTKLIQKLSQHTPEFADPFTDSSPRASVLIALKIDHEQLWVLLTKRSSHLNSHGGEVAFPGGKRDADDTSNWETALREAYEEVGLPPDCVTQLCTLHLAVSKNRLLITPCVALIPADFAPIPNPSEVEACFWVPLDTFLKADIHHHQDIMWGAGIHRMHSFLYATNEGVMNVFGLTAGLCITTAEIAFQRQPEYDRRAQGEIKRDYSRFRDFVRDGHFHLLPHASIPHSQL